jgi:hypothetical protein
MNASPQKVYRAINEKEDLRHGWTSTISYKKILNSGFILG